MYKFIYLIAVMGLLLSCKAQLSLNDKSSESEPVPASAAPEVDSGEAAEVSTSDTLPTPTPPPTPKPIPAPPPAGQAFNLIGQYADFRSPPLEIDYPGEGPNGGAHAHVFSSVEGVAIDSVDNRLFVSDRFNHRILIYQTNADGSLVDHEADWVLGQSDFTQNNLRAASAADLNDPWGIAYEPSSKLLFVADSDNDRVLVFDVATVTNHEPAVNVLGKPDFTSTAGACTAASLALPTDLAIDTSGKRLFVGTMGYRVSVFDITSITNGEDAVNVLGASDFTTCISLSTTQSSTRIPRSVAYDSTTNRLFVGEQMSFRISVFDVTSITNGENAINVLGPLDFTTSNPTTTASGINMPLSLAIDETNQLLYSGQNGRILVFDVTAITNGEGAVNVLGSDDFTSISLVDDAGSFSGTALAYDAGNQKLTVGDNARLLQLDVSTISDGEDAIAVSGQYIDKRTEALTPDFSKSGQNGSADSFGLNNPKDVLEDTDNKRIYVTDMSNNRILVYNLESNGYLHDHEPDYVLGQADFQSSDASTTQNTLDSPTSMALDSARNFLFVSDRLNNRIMVFDVSTLTNGKNAAYVLGQSDFTSSASGCTLSGMSSPAGIDYDPTDKKLYLGTGNRVLVYDLNTITNGEDAIHVLGQTDFTTCSSGRSQSEFNGLGDLVVDSANRRLFVGERGRVLVFDINSITDGEAAINVLGEPNFTDDSRELSASGFNSILIGLAYEPERQRLWVSDQTARRILGFDVTVIVDGEPAVAVIGQDDFTSDVREVARDAMSQPASMYFNPSNNALYSADYDAHRVLMFYTSEL